MITYEYDLDVTPGSVPVCVNLSQYDWDYELKFHLYSREGTLDIREGTTAVIRGTKKDGNGYSVDAAVSGNVVTVSGDQQMTAVSGQQFFEIKLESDGKELNTANFVICIERAPMDKDTVKSLSVIKELENASGLAEKIIKTVEKTKGDIEKTAEAVKVFSEKAESGQRMAEAGASQAMESAEKAEACAREAESHSHGGTGTRRGEDTDNSLYYSQQSRKEYERSRNEADRASHYADFVTPHFLLLNNRLYMKRGGSINFILANNRIYIRMEEN